MRASSRFAVAGLATVFLCCLYGQVVAAPPVVPATALCRPAIFIEGRLHCGEPAFAVLDVLCDRGFADADPGVRAGDHVSLAEGCRVDGRIPGPELVDLGVSIDLNSASALELEGLPGIGPTLAGRIVAARPLRRVEDLLHVQGIGPIRMARLRSLVTATPLSTRDGS